jgi:GYF domain 2
LIVIEPEGGTRLEGMMVGAGDWYAGRNGSVIGPLTLAELRSRANEGTLLPGDFVWSPDMSGWTEARQVPDLWLPPKLPEPDAAAEEEEILQLTDDQEVDAVANKNPAALVELPNERPAGSPRKAPNLLVRHWKGNLSLGWSYWGAGALLTIIIYFAVEILGPALAEASLGPVATGFVMLLLIAFLSLVTVWQFVGIWRSAGKQIKRGKRTYWGGLARIAVVLGVLRTGAEVFTVTGPLAIHSFQLAIGKEDIPNYRIRILRDATEVELSGGMRYGVTDAVEKVLDAAPTVRLIHLNSIGGQIDEGHKLYRLIKNRNLITYTSSNCYSACTLPFLAGKQRYLASGAKLGFHSGSFGSLDQSTLPEINASFRQTLAEQGVPSWFLQKAFSTPAKDLWYPTQEQLLAARIITKVVDSNQFAISGLPSIQDVELNVIFLKIPLYRIIRDVDPEAYNKLSEKFNEEIRAGRSSIEIQNSVGGIIQSELIQKYLRIAPDHELHAYRTTQIQEVAYLQAKDPNLCIQFFFPEKRGAAFDLTRLLPQTLRERDINALTNLIRAAARSPVIHESSEIAEDLATVMKRVSTKVPDAANILSEPEKHLDQSARLCEALLIFYEEILSLPEQRSGPMLRIIVSN